MKKLFRWLLLIPAAFPAACHYQWTTPLLWNQGSSAAFDLLALGWVVSIGLFVWAFINATSRL